MAGAWPQFPHLGVVGRIADGIAADVDRIAGVAAEGDGTRLGHAVRHHQFLLKVENTPPPQKKNNKRKTMASSGNTVAKRERTRQSTPTMMATSKNEKLSSKVHPRNIEMRVFFTENNYRQKFWIIGDEMLTLGATIVPKLYPQLGLSRDLVIF